MDELGLPFAYVASPEEAWTVTNDGILHGSAPAQTDLFVDPAGSAPTINAPTLLGDPGDGDFQFVARVTVDFASTFDAGVLLLWSGGTSFAKLCFEYSPAGDPMIVSVVTRGVSDDANAFTVAGNAVRLRISRMGAVFAFHASTDSETWQLIRVFAMDTRPSTYQLGFAVQSPTGGGCHATFDEISFSPEPLADVRNGS